MKIEDFFKGPPFKAGALDEQELEKIYWKFKGMELKLAKKEEFWNSTNKTIAQAYEELEKKSKQLKEAEDELVKSSYLAGMADVASSIMHNVGNALTSVNTSCGLMYNELKNSSIELLSKTIKLVEENRENFVEYVSNDPKGKLLPNFLIELSRTLDGEVENLVSENIRMKDKIGYINKIVSLQQELAHLEINVVRKYKLVKLLDQVVQIQKENFSEHNIKLTLKCWPTIHVCLNQVKFIQILNNILNNAIRALENTEGKVISISVTSAQKNVVLTISDNGKGMTKEELKVVFCQESKSLGPGLHVAALALKEIGGDISASSDGIGKGCTFVISVPVRERVD